MQQGVILFFTVVLTHLLPTYLLRMYLLPTYLFACFPQMPELVEALKANGLQ